jgi:nitrite transporter NirC
MNENHIILRAVMAGLFIGIAGLIFLSVENKTLGALLFSFGLLMVVSKGYFLYTGKVGYALPYQKGYLSVLLKTLLGNIIGIGAVGLMFQLSGMTEVIASAEMIFVSKLSKTWYESFILAIFCGMLMYVGVNGYKKYDNPILKVLIVIFAVVIFILAKFEHSIANLLYLFLGNHFTLASLLYVMIWMIGNALGAILLNLVDERLNQSV